MILLFFFWYLFFYSAALLSYCGTWDLKSWACADSSCTMRAVMAACLVPSPGIEPSPPALGNEESELVGHLGSPLPRLFICICIIFIHTHIYPSSFVHLHCGKKDRRGGRERPREQLGCSCHHPRSGGGPPAAAEIKVGEFKTFCWKGCQSACLCSSRADPKMKIQQQVPCGASQKRQIGAGQAQQGKAGGK